MLLLFLLVSTRLFVVMLTRQCFNYGLFPARITARAADLTGECVRNSRGDHLLVTRQVHGCPELQAGLLRMTRLLEVSSFERGARSSRPGMMFYCPFTIA